MAFKSRATAKQVALQGWAIDEWHDLHKYLNVDNALYRLVQSGADREGIREDGEEWTLAGQIRREHVLSFIAAHTEDVLSSPSFARAPVGVVCAVLSLNNLAVSEDDLLDFVVQYAINCASVLTNAPSLWTEEERAALQPVFRELIPRLRTFSVSTPNFVRIVEPLDVLPVSELIAKYRYDALRVDYAASGQSELEMIERCYVRPAERWELFTRRLRTPLYVLESEHPYHVGEDEVLEEVVMPARVRRIRVEFDRRTCIGEGARLSFYKDCDARDVIGDWGKLWLARPRSHGIKSWVVEGSRFFVGFKCSVAARAAWGWKFVAIPVFDAAEDDGGDDGDSCYAE